MKKRSLKMTLLRSQSKKRPNKADRNASESGGVFFSLAWVMLWGKGSKFNVVWVMRWGEWVPGFGFRVTGCVGGALE